MSNKITLAKLASDLSAVTGCSEATSEQFLKVLIDEFSDTIAQGGTVRIDGIGELKADSSTREVKWTVDEELAAVLNEPFSAFEPVVLESGVTEEILEGVFKVEGEEEEEAKAESEPVVEPIETTPTSEQPQEAISETLPEVVEATETPELSESPEKPDLVETPELPESPEKLDLAETPELPESPESPEVADEPMVYKKPRRRNPLIQWIFFLVGLVAGLTIGYIAGLCCHTSSDIPEIAEVVEVSVEPTAVAIPADSSVVAETSDSIAVDTMKATETLPKVDPVITDTVTASRYLTTLSRKYFGDFRFWIYIYEENKAKIDNPDRITPGTVVVIPEKEKYGIDSSNPESIRKAELLIREHYNSHKK